MKTALSVFLLGLAVIGYVVPSKGFQVNPCAVTERKVVSQLKRTDKEAFFKDIGLGMVQSLVGE